MKLVERNIDLITYHDPNGVMRPVRFRLSLDDQSRATVDIEQILKLDLVKNNTMTYRIYTCESQINGEKKIFQIRFNVTTHKWDLYKI